MSGTSDESGENHQSDEYTSELALAADGTWSTTSSSASGSGSSKSDYSSSGSGTYSHSKGTSGSGDYSYVSGTEQEHGGEGSSDQFSTQTELVDGVWQQTAGSGRATASSSSDYSYSGAGSYVRLIAGGTINGTISEDGSMSQSRQSTAYYEWQSPDEQATDDPDAGDGEENQESTDGTDEPSSPWVATSGSGSSQGSSKSNYNSSGSGAYNRDVAGVPIQGNASESYSEAYSEGYSTQLEKSKGSATVLMSVNS